MHRLQSLIVVALMTILALTANGCLEIETTTKINSDGSVIRTVVMTGDSSSIYQRDFAVTVDSTWDTQIQQIERNKFVRTATKVFREVGEMNKALMGEEGRTLSIRADLERHFRWFFTTIRYRETWLNFNPFRAVPITDYISPTELEYFMRHELKKEPYRTKGDSLAFEDAGHRFERWNARNIFEAYFQTFVEGIRKLNDRSLTLTYVAGLKQRLFEASEESFKANNVDTVRFVFERVLKTPAVRKAIAANSEGFHLFKQKLDFLHGKIGADTYRTNVVMPGLIIDTNAPSIEGTKASWSDYTKFCYFTDFEMWVESKVTNWWAITLTGLFVTAIAVGFVLAAIRRRKPGA